MPTVMLTDHFSLDEMIATSHREFDNTPPEPVVTALRRTAQLLEEIRTLLGDRPVLVTSGYRCPALNRAVGGVANSQHVVGQAADFICPSFGTPREVWQRLFDSPVQYDQLIYEHPTLPSWCHVSWSNEPRRQAFELGTA